jgi:hypothetical protein
MRELIFYAVEEENLAPGEQLGAGIRSRNPHARSTASAQNGNGEEHVRG